MFLSFSWFCCVALAGLPLAWASCISQCSCFYHNLSDGSKARSVLCNDPEISSVPANFPADTSKLRIEKTAIRRIPSEAFHYLSNLEFLWMSFNSLSTINVDSFRGLYSLDELRLDGNELTSFPWESLIDMPNLRLLDLHNNQLTAVPAEATVHMKNITYLDLSSNNLVTVPSEVLAAWLSVKPSQGAYSESSKMILGLHDNPWYCDCRLYDLVHFLKSPSSSLAFIDGRLRCSDPESLSGVLFNEVELRKCQIPTVHTAVARVRSAVGNNVMLRCGTIGVPIPDLTWKRVDGRLLNGTVQQEISKEGIIWSILNVPVVSYRDSGKYICRATNFIGSADAIISLVITDFIKPENQTSMSPKRTRSRRPNGVVKAAYQEKLVARYVVPMTTTVTPNIQINGYSDKYPDLENYSLANGQIPNPDRSNGQPDGDKTSLSNLASNTSSLQQEPERVVRSVKVIGDTDHTVSLTWRAPQAKNTTMFSVLYAVFGEREMRRINVDPGKNRITIDGLMPKTKYIACVCVKGLIPKKEQCVIFSTDEAASANGTQKLINVVVITVACVIAVPLTLIVCCGALKRRCKKLFRRKAKDIQDSYVTFETLSPGPKAKGLEGEYLTRSNPEESNRLLSARSSLDSEATAKIEGQPNEYFC
ncbi:leucine-rich repeat, immunoglobulin-like domain and transmembrane domain-containing protein 1a [Polypterus senegalus]|uniref:leucine-rich repeat, immunoglobulin-like domain and transmembrane domain-containing protein 1a n=1 Tax=Polypterus senegalus TaxID=55291 RepID=UPI001965EEF4|nr:leucine-rich repeat, immunoglobulin-like domain and transmembrane domain-containing protein 1a [Polypterus senegalus]